MSYERTIWPGDLNEIAGKRHFIPDPTAPGNFVDERAMVRLKQMENGIYDAHVAIDAYEARWFNVVEYGATGDGITDDTAAIQAAINAAKVTYGGVLYFPKPSSYYKVTQLSLNTVSGMIWLGEEGADFDITTHTIKGSGASVIDIQKCTNMVFKNLRFGGDGSNTCWDIHGGGAGAYNWRIENCNFHEFDVGWQIGQCSTENGGSVVTYAYGWNVDLVSFEDCARSIILDAQAFEGFNMRNVSFEDYNDISVIHIEAIQGVSGDLTMDNCYGTSGSSTTHFIKIHTYVLNLRSVKCEGGDTYLSLYSANAGALMPSVLQNCYFTDQDGDNRSIRWGNTEGLVIIGGNYDGDIFLGQPMPCLAQNVRDSAGNFASFTGSLHGLMEMRLDPGGTLPNDGFMIARHLRADRGLQLADGVTAPATVAGYGLIYIDTADGDLKIRFGDGTVKTIVVDT